MDEFEDQDPEQEPTGFEALPPQTQRELKKLRAAERNLRKRNEALAHDALVARFGPDVVAMIPEEVTTYERRVELAESFKESLTPPEPEPEPQEVEPVGLAAVMRPPSPGSQAARGPMTFAEVKALAKTDPQAADAIIRQGRYQALGHWDGTGFVADEGL